MTTERIKKKKHKHHHLRKPSKYPAIIVILYTLEDPVRMKPTELIEPHQNLIIVGKKKKLEADGTN
jgi:hypothetical protein